MIDKTITGFKVGLASCGIAAGGDAVLEALKNAVNLPITEVGCIGHCYAEPLVEVCLADGSSIMYGNVKADEKSIQNILSLGENGRFEIPAARKEKELLKVLSLAGHIAPTKLEDYTANGGYEGLKKALTLSPEEVINEIYLNII